MRYGLTGLVTQLFNYFQISHVAANGLLMNNVKGREGKEEGKR